MQKTHKKKFATLKDVAQKIDVSPITVSRVFNPKTRNMVKEETCKKVLAAAAELGYSPNAFAKGLISQQTNIIAVILGKEISLYYGSVLKKLIFQAQKIGKQILVFCTDPNLGLEGVIEKVYNYRVDAIIITSAATKGDIVDFDTINKIPIILFDRKTQVNTVSAIWANNYQGAQLAADLFIDRGCTNLAYISGDLNASTELERKIGFIDRLNERGIAIQHVIDGDYFYESGYRNAIELFRKTKNIDGIFCAQDIIAMGVIDALRLELKLSVPQDVSVIGFENDPMGKLPAYQLTSLKQPLDEMIENLVQIIEHVSEDAGLRISKEYPMEIIHGETVKQP